MWRLCRLGFRYEPALMGIALHARLVAAVPDALLAVWFKLLGEGLLEHQSGLLRFAVVALAVSAAATWLLSTVSTRIQRRFRDKVTIALESHVARLQASIATIAHQERPEYLDRLSVLREETYTLDHMYMSVFSTVGWLLRLAITVALLAAVNPVLIMLVLFAIPTVAATSWRPAVERTAQERGAQSTRLAAHLYALSTTALARQGTAGARHRPARSPTAAGPPGSSWYGPVAAARSRSAAWYAAGWAVFALGYVGAIALVATGPRASAAGAILVLTAGARLSSYLGATVSEIGFLRGTWMDGAQRLAWLEDYASAAVTARGPARAGRHRRGHPARARDVPLPGRRPARARRREPVPPGRIGGRHRRRERGGQVHAGQAAREALLPHHGPHSRRRHGPGPRSTPRAGGSAWPGRSRTSSASSSTAAHTIGIGDLPRLDVEPALVTAAERAGARDLVDALPAGLRTQLGPTWPEGVDVSYGQWQKLALARGFMRDEPLLVALDEPTAALDAETEHQLFERYAATRQGGQGERERDHPGVAPVQHGPDGRPHRGARRRPRRRGRQPRGTAGPRRPLRRPVPHPGRGIQLTGTREAEFVRTRLLH